MRKLFLLAAVIVACSKAETPPTDTAAAMAPAPPASLAPGDLAGTWNGISKAPGTDSIVSKWTVVSTSDTSGTVTYEGTKTAIPFVTVFDGDSAISTSGAYLLPGAKKGAGKVMFRSVGRMQNGQFVGTAALMLATKHDSIVSRNNFVATKAP